MAGDSGISRRTLLKGGAALGAGLALGPATSTSLVAGAGAPRRERRRKQPNIIVITADDMRYDEAPYMPSLQRLMVKQGTSFAAARCNIAECSPSRAGFLTGQYSKRHRVLGQVDSFSGHNDVQRTLPVWMQAAGYHTGIIGKYFTTRRGQVHAAGLGRAPAAGRQEPGAVRLRGVGRHRRCRSRSSIRPGSSSRRSSRSWRALGAPSSCGSHPPRITARSRRRPRTGTTTHACSGPIAVSGDVSDKPAWIQQLEPIDGSRPGVHAQGAAAPSP